jgi:hypothetical protein
MAGTSRKVETMAQRVLLGEKMESQEREGRGVSICRRAKYTIL